MIVLTKMNGEQFLLNHQQMECIELIPETKVVMMNHSYYLVREKAEEIVQKIAEYTAKVQDIHRMITIPDGGTALWGEVAVGDEGTIHMPPRVFAIKLGMVAFYVLAALDARFLIHLRKYLPNQRSYEVLLIYHILKVLRR